MSDAGVVTYVPVDDVGEIDLGRHALVEASAGTGKTYTIENLVVRFLKKWPELQLENILLVTFTEKATGELKARIRQKIENTLGEDDGLDARQRQKFQETLNHFDSAAIHTIHGFCHTLLKMFPFETGNLFEQELIDEGPLLEKLLRDQMRRDWPDRYGRRLDTLLALSGFPEGAEKFVRRTVNLAVRFGDLRQGVQLLPDLAGKELSELWRSAFETIATLKSLAGEPPQLSDGYNRLNINKRSKDAILRDMVTPLETVLQQADSDDFRLSALTPLVAQLKKRTASGTNLDRLIPGKWLKAGPNLHVCPNLAGIKERLDLLIRQITDLSYVLMVDAVQRLHRDAQAMKRRNGWMSYQDMLTRVADWLAGESAGESIDFIRQRYRIAFVDEFQDTDDVQWAIFSRLFLQERVDPKNRLFLIGDPKQAIYAFRGADVFTYLEARQRMTALAAAGHARLYGLAVNWRSVPPLMTAFNRLFVQDTWFGASNLDRPFEIGYARTGSPGAGQLPFTVLSDRSHRPAFNVIDLRRAATHGVAKMKLAGFISREIVTLITRGGIRIENTDGRDRPLHYGDIAVLVRSQSEFVLLEPFLKAASIPYRFYRKPGLFQCREAHWLSLVLHAVCQPDQPPVVRMAMLTPFFDISPEALARWPEIPSDHTSQHLLTRWSRLGEQRRWGPLFQSLMEDSGMVLRHCSEADWARTVTNFRQLFDYLDVSAFNENLDMAGMTAALDALRRSEMDAGTGEDIHAIEDEGQKIQIMTMHMSKGLEFPVVFIGGGLTVPGNTGMHVYHMLDPACPDDGFNKVVDLTDGSTGAQIEKERDDDDKRLYYVAFTRAKLKLYIPYYPAAGRQRWRGPICRFVSTSVDSAFSARDVKAGILGWHEADAVALPEETMADPQAKPTGVELPPDDLLPSQVDFRHRKTALESFSSIGHRILRKDAFWEPQPNFYPDSAPGRDDDEPAVQPPIDPVAVADPDVLPGGSVMGSMFHHIFENIDFQAVFDGPADLLANDPVRQVIDSALSIYGVESTWRQIIAQIVANTLNKTIRTDHATFTLSALKPGQRRHEMEFFFPLAAIPPADMGIPGCTFVTPPCGELMVRGFIDLVFKWQDRYYFADWKSNRIGDGYAVGAMQRTMASAGYDLQYQLYAVAVLRWLQQQLGDRFEPQRHFGGVFYFFIRGMGRPGQSGILHISPETLLPIEALQQAIQAQINGIRW